MDLYREIILEHYKTPQHRGHVVRADKILHATNPICGDALDVELQIDADGHIEDAKFSGTGCAISQASADLILEVVKGKGEKEVSALSKEDVFDALGGPVSPGREKCALLVLQTLQKPSPIAATAQSPLWGDRA